MLRVFRDPDGEWWADRAGVGVSACVKDGPKRVSNVDEFEDEVASRLAILLHVDPGASFTNVGRRITDDTFWLFFEKED